MAIRFTTKERRFLESHDVCRLATSSAKGWPLVTPVCYLMIGDFIYIATDYGTTKMRHLKENPKASLVVDEVNPNRAVVLQGLVDIIERGQEFDRAYGSFYDKFGWVRSDPWKAGEAPFLRFRAVKKMSWL